jgi:hypothetical protein
LKKIHIKQALHDDVQEYKLLDMSCVSFNMKNKRNEFRIGFFLSFIL